MAKNQEIPALLVSFLVTGAVLGGAYWWLTRPSPQGVAPPAPSPSPSLPAPPQVRAFDPPTSVPAGMQLRIDGSTSMAKINKNFQQAFQAKFPGSQVLIDAQGSDKGILSLLLGTIDLAAVSHELLPEQKAQGLIAVPVTDDAIALVVGKNNPYRRGLTQAQVKDIFQGKITNWSELGGKDQPLRVLNRPAISGTQQVFQQLALGGEAFGTTPNITTQTRDATTPLLQSLGEDGISYATAAQVVRQQTVRVVPIDGLVPESPQYPYQRRLYYVYKDPPSPAVTAFLGFISSPEGQASQKP